MSYGPTIFRYEITFLWKGRDGRDHSLTVDDTCHEDNRRETFDRMRSRAMQKGYPGHRGGRWNYLVDDFHNWLAKRGWTKCECHT